MDFDVIVIGGGSAGSAAAAAATAAGARTAMVNRDELGGLCILRGCMPTKAMLASAHAVHHAAHLEEFGARLDGRVELDFAAVMARKDAQVRRFQRAKIASIERHDYEVVFGDARFDGDGTLLVDGRPLSARSYVVATGSTPRSVPVPGLAGVPVLTSDDVMRLTERPRAVLVLGAGPVGLELGQFFARVGSRVLLVNRSPLLSRLDADCGLELHGALADDPRLELAVPGRIERVAPRDGGLVATVASAGGTRRFEADFLLMAVGRDAAVADLGLDNVGVRVAGGAVEHDSGMRTANPAIWVAGDATGRHQILHVSTGEGRVAGHNAAVGANERALDDQLRMEVYFTDPPFATAGATEREARAGGRDVVVAMERFPETGRAITMGARHGMWKLFADRESGEILGSAILGPRADDLAHLVTTLMHWRATAADALRLPWYHPTLSEVMIGLTRLIEAERRGS